MLTSHLPAMQLPNMITSRFLTIALMATAIFAHTKLQTVAQESIFPDKQLEAAVRRQVFEKRDTQDPLTADDVKQISHVVGNEMEIASLEGLQHCISLRRIELRGNAIQDLTPIANLKLVQWIDLSHNQISNVEALQSLERLQYLKLSHNMIDNIQSVAALSNMHALYLDHNQLKSIDPIADLKKINSLDASHNPLENFSVIANLRWVSSLDLSHCGVKDLHFLMLLQELRTLNLSHNEVTDVTPLIEMCRADADGRRQFAPFLQLYLSHNPVTDNAEQLQQLKSFGVRITIEPESQSTQP